MSSKSRYIPSQKGRLFAWYDCPITLGKYKRKIKAKRKAASKARAMNRKRSK